MTVAAIAELNPIARPIGDFGVFPACVKLEDSSKQQPIELGLLVSFLVEWLCTASSSSSL